MYKKTVMTVVLILVMLGTFVLTAKPVQASQGCPPGSDCLLSLEQSLQENSPQAISWNETEFGFRAGTSNGSYLYFNSLKICGYNQYNNYVCWSKTFPNWTYNQYTLRNWWWKASRGVTFTFYLNGYGTRTCTVYEDPGLLGYWSPLYAKYLGNNTCKVE